MIERAVRLARATSSTTSIVLLVALNLIPLIGVLVAPQTWNVATILVLYWVENGIVGLLNIPKMLMAAGPPEPPNRTVEVRGIGPVTVSRSGPTEKAALVPFFLLHYGIFWLVHGVFVFALPAIVGLRDAFPADPRFSDGSLLVPTAASTGPNWDAIVVGAIALGISRTASFLVNYVGRGEYRRVTAIQQMFAPYGRLVILHLTILFGAFVSLAIGSPVGAIVVLVLVKTVVDLGFHLREHGRLAGAGTPS